MNYIEWVLVRASALWRAREETLKGRLAQSVPAEPAESGGARGGEEAAARLKRRLYGQTENDAAASELMADAERAAAAETLALSLERDARRYDGGFLFY